MVLLPITIATDRTRARAAEEQQRSRVRGLVPMSGRDIILLLFQSSHLVCDQ